MSAVDYAVIGPCTGPDCADCAYSGCDHVCHVGRQAWSPTGGWTDIAEGGDSDG